MNRKGISLKKLWEYWQIKKNKNKQTTERTVLTAVCLFLQIPIYGVTLRPTVNRVPKFEILSVIPEPYFIFAVKNIS